VGELLDSGVANCPKLPIWEGYESDRVEQREMMREQETLSIPFRNEAILQVKIRSAGFESLEAAH